MIQVIENRLFLHVSSTNIKSIGLFQYEKYSQYSTITDINPQIRNSASLRFPPQTTPSLPVPIKTSPARLAANKLETKSVLTNFQLCFSESNLRSFIIHEQLHSVRMRNAISNPRSSNIDLSALRKFP